MQIKAFGNKQTMFILILNRCQALFFMLFNTMATEDSLKLPTMQRLLQLSDALGLELYWSYIQTIQEQCRSYKGAQQKTIFKPHWSYIGAILKVHWNYAGMNKWALSSWPIPGVRSNKSKHIHATNKMKTNNHLSSKNVKQKTCKQNLRPIHK